MLVDIAEKSGLDRQVIARLLASDADAQTVAARELHAREKGISAVPTYIVADTHVISGAQQPALWGRVIDELLNRNEGQE